MCVPLAADGSGRPNLKLNITMHRCDSGDFCTRNQPRENLMEELVSSKNNAPARAYVTAPSALAL
jgi:hypothetical protein